MNPVLRFLIDWIEARYPGIRQLIEAALPYIDPNQIAILLLQALHDYQAGMDFFSILRDLLQMHMPVGQTLPEKA